MDELVEKYVLLRDKKAEITAAYKEQVGRIDDVLDKLEAQLLTKFDELGLESVRTSHGTAYKSHKTFASVGDWDSIIKYVHETGNWQLLTRNVSKQAVCEFMDETGELPPGVNWRDEVVVNVRRS